jgi:AraC-like DNA-binding protein
VAHAEGIAAVIEGESVAEAAGTVGCESEAAFSRAFKKLVCESPATWRRANVAPASSTSFRIGFSQGNPAVRWLPSRVAS